MIREYKKISKKMAEQFVNSVDNILYMSEKPLTINQILVEYDKRGLKLDDYPKDELEECLIKNCVNYKKVPDDVRFIGGGRGDNRTYDNLYIDYEPNRNKKLFNSFRKRTESEYEKIENNFQKINTIFKRIILDREKLISNSDLDIGLDVYLSKMKNIPPHKALLLMFSLLNKEKMLCGKKDDVDLLIELQYLHNQNYPKGKHIKEFLKKLEDHIKYSSEKSDELGEVMTKLSLVSEILDVYPAEDYKNPYIKWIDGANGVGPFIVSIIDRLMDGLEDYNKNGLDLTNEEVRFKYIIEKMIYVCEIQDENLFIYWMAVNPHCEYNLNIQDGSFLDPKFDATFPEVDFKYEEVRLVCNPPYNKISFSEEKDRDNGHKKIWMEFVEKSLKIGDEILFITPNNWLSKTCHLNSIYKDKLVYANIDSNYLKTKFFPKVNSTFSYYRLSNKKDKPNPIFILNNEKMEFNILDMTISPLSNINPITYSIFDKILKSGFAPYEFKRCDDGSNSKGELKWNKVLANVNKDMLIYFNRAKATACSGYSDNILTSSSYWYECNSIDEKEILLANLNNPLYKLIISSIRSGAAIVSTINSVPIINKRFNSELELYESINLSEKEINYLNKSKK